MTLSLRAYAAHRRAKRLPGATLPAVQQAAAAGRIPIEPDGRIDAAAADSAWSANTDEAKRPPLNGAVHSNGYVSSLVDARTIEAIERARRLRMENDLRAGELVEVVEVDRILSRLVTETRNDFLGVPTRLRMRRPDLSREDLEAVDTEIRSVLEELADRTQGGHREFTRRAGNSDSDSVDTAGTNGGGTSRGRRASAPAAGRGANRARESTRPSRASRAPGSPRPVGAGDGAERSAPAAAAVIEHGAQ